MNKTIYQLRGDYLTLSELHEIEFIFFTKEERLELDKKDERHYGM
jgi:hypothetical protein